MAEAATSGATTAVSAKGRIHTLSVAPDEWRCEQILEYDDDSEARCSRWVIGAHTAKAEPYCVGHSSSRRAKAARSRGAKRKAAAQQSDIERRRELYDAYVGRFRSAPASQAEVDALRYVLTAWLLLDYVSPAQCRELRAMASDWERALHLAELRRVKEQIRKLYEADIRCAIKDRRLQAAIDEVVGEPAVR